ncbi:MAG: tellurite resistance protein permease, partial [Brevibacterium aurantiacum]|nr:tellurite resistance protein permease [Brevibacterium aurantiacum]
RHRIPLGYSAGLWSMVFPLGMYSVASTNVGKVDDVPIISWIGAQWYWIALAVWAIVFAAMVWSFVKSMSARGSSGVAAG